MSVKQVVSPWRKFAFQDGLVYLDNHVLAGYKPPGLLSQGDKTQDIDMLTLGKRFLKEKYQKDKDGFLLLVHRLDRPTSGVICFARTKKAASRIGLAFQKRQIQKTYLAVVRGELKGQGKFVDEIKEKGKGVHHTTIHPFENPNVDPTHPDIASRISVLHWESLATCKHRSESQTLLKVNLGTGRKHQIRAQFGMRGYPIVGDTRYGTDSSRIKDRSIALHSLNMTLAHPVRKNVKLSLTAPLPETWKTLFSPEFYEVANHLKDTEFSQVVIEKLTNNDEDDEFFDDDNDKDFEKEFGFPLEIPENMDDSQVDAALESMLPQMTEKPETLNFNSLPDFFSPESSTEKADQLSKTLFRKKKIPKQPKKDYEGIRLNLSSIMKQAILTENDENDPNK